MRVFPTGAASMPRCSICSLRPEAMRHCSHLHGEFQIQLRVSTRGRLKEIRGKAVFSLRRKAQPARSQLKTLANKCAHGARGMHAGPEVGVVVTLAAHGP